ncbi:MAG: hypothetical protein FWC59_00040, partial [Actinomycetia bacterium]|nr:hypothetical protein [Actinomycetes bacterium]
MVDDTPTTTGPVASGSLQPLKCEFCGGTELVPDGDYLVCTHCGTRFVPPQLETPASEVSTRAENWQQNRQRQTTETSNSSGLEILRSLLSSFAGGLGASIGRYIVIVVAILI